MKKRIFSLLIAVVMVFLILPVQSFAAPVEVKGAFVDQNFDTVIDTVLGAKTFSRSGDVPEGLKLSGTWAYKNTFGDYVFKMSLSGKPTKAGTYNFSVSYKKEDGTVVEKVDYTVIVGEKAPFVFVHSINVDKWPDKTTYYLGDRVDLTGMKVSAVVFDYYPEENIYKSREMDVTEWCWVEPEIFTSDEPMDVKVYFRAPGDQYGNLQTFESHFRVGFKYANPEDVTRIEVYKAPEKTTYTVGEKLDTTGLTIRLHKGNGNAEDITEGFTVDTTKLEEVGTKTVTVKYVQNNNEFTATFDVKVEEKVESSSSSSSEQESSSSSSSEPVEEPSSSESSSEVVEEPSSSESSSEESSEPVEEPVSSEEPSSEESSSEEQEIVVVGDEVEEPSDDEGIPFWVWIIIGLLVLLIGSAVALFIIGRKRIDDEY